MSRARRGGLLEELADLDDPTPKDFDPEDNAPQDSEDELSDDRDDEDATAREHYVSVGKSKLRTPAQPRLGPQYAGSRIGRDEVAAEEEDDPFARGFEDEGSEQSGEQSVGSEDSDAGTDSELEASDDDEDDSQSSVEGDAPILPLPVRELSEEDKAAMQQALKAHSKVSTQPSANGVKEDALKGQAVKQQRTTFDNLLNVRIKLQKSLIGANTLSGLVSDEVEVDEKEISTALDRAESAALTLWNNLAALRTALTSARSGSKRDHTAFAADEPTSALWTHTKSQNAASQPHLDSTLEKWYNKTHANERLAAASRNKFTQASASTLHDVLASHLADRTRLLKRARTPRSCAPYQLASAGASNKRARLPATAPSPTHSDDDDRATNDDGGPATDTGDATVYDDADFYSMLLSTLLEQRASISNTPNGHAAAAGASGGGGGGVGNMTGHQLRREAKTRRANVDTKASKGRKLRYTVHEKLLNYCAPEDRGSWAERQVDELFSGLLGRRVGLDEDVVDAEMGMEEGIVGEEEGALLFGR